MDEAQKEVSGRLYGRKWKIVIYKPAYKEDKTRDTENDIAMDVSLLRCVFKTQHSNETAATICTLEVYNMNADTEAEVIKAGFQISIEAGYEEGQYGEIFTGDVVQVIRNRENGIDYKLEIIAIKGNMLFDGNHVRSVVAAGSDPRMVAKDVSEKAVVKLDLGEVSDNLSKQKLPRGKVLFGTPEKYLRDLCIANNAYYWTGTDDKLVIKKVADQIPADQCLVLSPGNPESKEPNMGGLVGTPQYGDDGIQIKILMDARVKTLSMVKIDNEWIRKQLININLNEKGQASKPIPQQSQFDKDGEYQVFAVAHQGDTHGNEWYTNIVGVGRNGRSGLLTVQDDKEQVER